MASIHDIIDIHAIAEIMQYGHSNNAAALCRSGQLKTARKVGNTWTAERWEVERLRAERDASPHGRRPSKRKG